jgi:hypothetical protein
MKLTADVIVDNGYLILPSGAVERLRIVLASPFARMSDGAVKPKSMQDALNKIRTAGLAIGYRRNSEAS